MSDFIPPSPASLQRQTALARHYFKPSFHGLDQLDLSRPALYVGNHTLYGLMDVPLMLAHLYVQHGVFLRSLGDRSHYAVPGWRDVLTHNGMVLGTPENCDALMEQGQSILVFPGGAREVMRRRGEEYQLIWKKRVGFVRMAIKHGYDIIPFASLGPDECFKILVDGNDINTSRAGRLFLAATGLGKVFRKGDVIPPVVRGVGPTLLPRPQRFYFSFGPRISSAGLNYHDDESLWDKREEVAASILGQLDDLKLIRKDDRSHWSWLRRSLTSNIET
jgi:1-acyl-sn-glycerol-3-phosphate acyltransferase